MFGRPSTSARPAPSLSFALLVSLLLIFWAAGGASRADALGQVVVRGAAWIGLVAVILVGSRRDWWRRCWPVTIILAAAIALAVIQLIPLPPEIWAGLPGRQVVASAAALSGEDGVWRPLSLSPSATENALFSLAIPLVTLVLAAGLGRAEHWRIVALLLGLAFVSSVWGLLQFSGSRLDHPLINDVAGFVSASFANRNHFALFAAIACLLALAWGFREPDGRQRGALRWRAILAIGLLLFFLLLILATGSRTGMLLGALAIATGFVLVRKQILGTLAQLPKKSAIGVASLVILAMAATVLLSVVLDRAVSIDRAMSLEIGDDSRRQKLPTVIEMAQLYFPAGSGFGTFDPVYRISERDEHLSRFYFNHAHNDYLEMAIDGGLAGLALLIAAIGWWLYASVGVWRSGSGSRVLLARLGSTILLLVFVASLTDYPARTPMIMALTVLAALWLHSARWPDDNPVQPGRERSRKMRTDGTAYDQP